METRIETERRTATDLSATDGTVEQRNAGSFQAASHEPARTTDRHQPTPRVSVDPMRSTDRYRLAQPTGLRL